jgi:hypothetical protein
MTQKDTTQAVQVLLRHPWMTRENALRRQRRIEREEAEARRLRELRRQRRLEREEEARRLREEFRYGLHRAIRVIAQQLEVHPVYPSDTDELEWRDPTPDGNYHYPRSPSDPHDYI